MSKEATPESMVSPEADALRAEYQKLVVVATKARAQGMDPSLEPDSTVAQDVAERVEKSVGPPGIAARIRELSPLIPREEVALKIAEEIALSNFTTKGEGAVDQAVRTAAAILDEGVTAAPLQGINAVKVKTNLDNTKYLAIYFAGPIRSAGGTDMGLIVVVADYVRQIVGLDRYKATDLDAKRFVEELRLYERDVARFQFHLPDALVHNVIMQLPVEVSGVETDKIEVSAYRNVPRIETNGVRGGALRVVNDGIMGRSQKVIKMIDKLSILGWDWLKEMHQPTEVDTKEAKEFMFMQDVIAGRPIFSFPGRPGGFRLRYGRSRATGLSAVGVHPATMSIVKDFIAIGTQLKMEKPGKAGIVTPVDTIEPPVVLLKDGSVIRVESVEKAREVRDSVESILSLGDVLVGFGEFLENNRPMVASGFVEEWWAQLLKCSIELGQGTLQKAAEITGITADRLTALVEHPLHIIPSIAECLTISKKLQTPLHPRYTWFWNQLTTKEWLTMREKLLPHLDGRTGKILIPMDTTIKAYLETLCIPHTLENGQILLGDEAPVLAECLGAGRELPKDLGANGLDAVRAAAGFPVYSRAGAFIGTRMGRPEKAKRREMKPVTHCLFPVGFTGGPRRNIVDAAKGKSIVEAEIVRRKCKNCGEITHLNKCPQCGGETEMEMVCPRCRKVYEKDMAMCPVCKIKCFPYDKRTVTVNDLWEAACKKLKLDKPPEMVKGVKGLTSGSKLAEPLEKGMLRAMNDLSMFKDGTVRFDATNAPLTHFKPFEVGATVEQLKKLGYTTDAYDEDFERPDQLLPIKLQDIVVSEACGDYLVRVSKFVDDLLIKFYGLEPYYQAKTRSDLVGQLVVGLSPHTSVGVIGRIIGFTKAKVCFAHPFWQAAKRRDCFIGDEIVPTFDGEEWRLSSMKELVESKLAEGISRAYPGGELVTDDDKLMTLALNPKNMRYEMKKITAYSKHPPQNHLVELVTKSGRKTTTTGVHQFPTLDGHRLEKVSAHEATAVLSPKIIDVPERDVEQIDLLQLHNSDIMVRGCGELLRRTVRDGDGFVKTFKKLGVSRSTLSNYLYRDAAPPWLFQRLHVEIPVDAKLSVRRNAVAVPRMIKVDAPFLELLGVYISEGYARKQHKRAYQITFCNKKLEKQVIRAAAHVFGISPSIGPDEQTLSSRLVYELFIQLLKCGENAHSKRVPNRILSLPKEKLKHFLRGYFGGNGSISTSSTLEVNCTSVSRMLLKDIEFLLWRMGIETSWYHDKREHSGKGVVADFYAKRGITRVDESYKLRVYAQNAKAFCESIGFLDERKAAAAKKIHMQQFASRSVIAGQAKIDRVRETNIIPNTAPLYNITVEDHHNLIASGIVSQQCDGDEDSVTLALDVLLNFSKAFLPSQIGGIMDAPILMTVALRPNEVARQVFNIETAETLPIMFFDEAAKGKDPKELTDLIPVISQRHGVEQMLRPVGFTHDISDMNSGTFDGSYSLLPTMLDKMSAQLDLAERIRAVIAPEVAKRVLSTHLMKDLVGNLRAFATQRVRCTKCNTKYRRPPLKGVCLRCGGKIMMTVHRGNVEKYLEVARNLVQRYDLGLYSSQRLLLLQEELKSLFTEDVEGKKKEEEKKQRAEKKREDAKKQPSLSDFL